MTQVSELLSIEITRSVFESNFSGEFFTEDSENKSWSSPDDDSTPRRQGWAPPEDLDKMIDQIAGQ